MMRRIWYDALVCTPRALRYLVEVVGADKVVLGADGSPPASALSPPSPW
jgi:hypothetical protein